MTLKTRKPTGAVPWPFILVEGPEKAGKTYTSALIACSKRIGRMFWLDLGEGAADEYGAIPGVDYDIVEHDGTFRTILQAVRDVRDEARRARDAGEKPVVFLIDGGNAEWELLKDMATAKARDSRWNRAKLQKDPNAEIDVSQNYWNDVTGLHRQMMALLLTFPGIVIMTCRGKEVAAVENGRPVEGKKDWRVEGHKSLGYDCNVWLRVHRDKPAELVGVRSVHHGIRPGTDRPKPLPKDWSLEWLIFDYLKCDPAKATTRHYIELVPDMSPAEIAAEAIKSTTTSVQIRALFEKARALDYGQAVEQNERGEDEPLPKLLIRIGKERKAAEDAHAAAVASIDQTAEAQWVADFLTRLSGACTPEAIDGLREDLANAVTDLVIRPATAEDLSAEAAGREKDMLPETAPIDVAAA